MVVRVAHALLIGATGATGNDLLDLLLKDDDFHRVDIFVRRDIDRSHEKLKVHVIDFDKPEQWNDLVKGDVLFSCLGTTLKAAGSKEAQWRIDHDYQFEFAKAARENGVHHYLLVSSSGASPDSLFFYPKMKGKLEIDVKSLGFAKLSIFNPPILERKNTDRSGEVIGVKIMRLVTELGLFRSQRPMPTEVLARALVNAAKAKEDAVHIYKADAIWNCAKGR
jgi:uncharacterized protein YbjT (DUF2867 family)